ncbi:hypothetical protein HZC09_06235 [Candidatus Micrarchaeota archaeon]|nr:hypothetical protein [Candidatus Micrarchaeota archaeon]
METRKSAEESRQILQTMDEFTRDKKWALENIDSLRKDYLEKYVLVKNRKVVLADSDYDNLLQRAERNGVDISQAVIEFVIPRNVTVLM